MRHSHRMTVRQAERLIRGFGCTVSRHHGEFRVNLPGCGEASAYYTEDAQDAVDTARAMVGWQVARFEAEART